MPVIRRRCRNSGRRTGHRVGDPAGHRSLPHSRTVVQCKFGFADDAAPRTGRRVVHLATTQSDNEEPMPDLYAINLHLQERLESDWRKEVRAPEAADWLHEAGLLPDRGNGPDLCELLAAGGIAGQRRRPDRKEGSWWIRRLAQSRGPQSIQESRRRLRSYLPLDRSILHPDWPLSRDNQPFWEELGKTVAAFGYLENTLVSACYSLTEPPASPGNIRFEQVPAYPQWYAGVEAFRTDSLRVLAQPVR